MRKLTEFDLQILERMKKDQEFAEGILKCIMKKMFCDIYKLGMQDGYNWYNCTVTVQKKLKK